MDTIALFEQLDDTTIDIVYDLHEKYLNIFKEVNKGVQSMSGSTSRFVKAILHHVYRDARKYNVLWQNTTLVSYCHHLAMRNESNSPEAFIWKMFHDLAVSLHLPIHVPYVVSDDRYFVFLPIKKEHMFWTTSEESQYYPFFETISSNYLIQFQEKIVIEDAFFLLKSGYKGHISREKTLKDGVSYKKNVVNGLKIWVDATKQSNIENSLSLLSNIHGGLHVDNILTILQEAMSIIQMPIHSEINLHIED